MLNHFHYQYPPSLRSNCRENKLQHRIIRNSNILLQIWRQIIARSNIQLIGIQTNRAFMMSNGWINFKFTGPAFDAQLLEVWQYTVNATNKFFSQHMQRTTMVTLSNNELLRRTLAIQQTISHEWTLLNTRINEPRGIQEIVIDSGSEEQQEQAEKRAFGIMKRIKLRRKTHLQVWMIDKIGHPIISKRTKRELIRQFGLYSLEKRFLFKAARLHRIRKNIINKKTKYMLFSAKKSTEL